MPRKKQSEPAVSAQHSDDATAPVPTPAEPATAQAPLNANQPVEEAAATAATQPQPAPTAEQPAKTWTKRPDPFGIESIRWPGGYRVSLKESDANREIFIQFGNGTKADAPQNFEAIRKLLKEDYGLHWDVQVQGWAKGLKQGVSPLIREHNKGVRTDVEEAFYKAVAMEEAVRGPSLSEHARERGGRAALTMTDRPFIPLGSAPCKEQQAQFGEPHYRANAHRECLAFIQAIRNYLGPEPAGAELDVKVFDGDRGMYYEVVCFHDEENKEAEDYAHRCERQAPHTWEEGSVKPPPRRVRTQAKAR